MRKIERRSICQTGKLTTGKNNFANVQACVYTPTEVLFGQSTIDLLLKTSVRTGSGHFYKWTTDL